MIPMKFLGGHSSGVKEPGDFTYIWKDSKPDQIIFANAGCKFGKCDVRLTEGPAVHPRWHWDGNLEKPTLTPSVGCDKRCGWHGHITNGEILP